MVHSIVDNFFYTAVLSRFFSQKNHTFWIIRTKKSLKIQKGQYKFVNRRRTDNTMTERKKDIRTNNDLQNTTQKTKDRTTRSPLQTLVSDNLLDILKLFLHTICSTSLHILLDKSWKTLFISHTMVTGEVCLIDMSLSCKWQNKRHNLYRRSNG